jgi:hypothetical protein
MGLFKPFGRNSPDDGFLVLRTRPRRFEVIKKLNGFSRLLVRKPIALSVTLRPHTVKCWKETLTPFPRHYQANKNAVFHRTPIGCDVPTNRLFLPNSDVVLHLTGVVGFGYHYSHKNQKQKGYLNHILIPRQKLSKPKHFSLPFCRTICNSL